MKTKQTTQRPWSIGGGGGGGNKNNNTKQQAQLWKMEPQSFGEIFLNIHCAAIA